MGNLKYQFKIKCTKKQEKYVKNALSHMTVI